MRRRTGRTSVFTVLWVLVIAGFAALLLPRMFGGGTEAPSDQAQGEPAPEAPDRNRVDPEPYKAIIQRLEATLYQASPGGMSGADRISGVAAELADAVMRREDRVRGPAAGLQILGFSSRLGAEADAGYPTVNLPRARTQWEEVRAAVFRPAPWFTGSTPGLASAQTSPVPAAPAPTVRDLTDAANNLESLIRLGRSNVAQFGEIGVDVQPGTRQATELAQGFDQWSRSWTDRINRLRRTFPSLGPNVDANLRMAFQELDRATRMLNEVGRTGSRYGVPYRAERESHFRNAEALLANARRYLARVGQ